MNALRLVVSLICCAMLATGASAQISLVPPAAKPAPAASKPTPPKQRKHTPLKKPAEAAKKPTASQAAPDAAKKSGNDSDNAAASAKDDPNIDLVYGAYQRGFYRTAFDLATKRATEKNDSTAMTMLGEL